MNKSILQIILLGVKKWISILAYLPIFYPLFKEVLVRIIWVLGGLSAIYLSGKYFYLFGNILYYYVLVICIFLIFLFYLYQYFLDGIYLIKDLIENELEVRSSPLDLFISFGVWLIFCGNCLVFLGVTVLVTVYIKYVDRLAAGLGALLSFISDFSITVNIPQIDVLYAYLDSLSLLEESAIFHIIVILTILIIVFNIYSVLLGNEILKYLNIEEKYPRLTKILKLRLQFQRYYLIFNLLYLICICIFVLFINILVLA